MSLLDFYNAMTVVWERVINFLNAPFMSAFVSALAGAGFGVLGAQKLAERSSRRKELLDSLGQANAIIVLAYTFTNQALTVKKQFVKPLSDHYFSDREEAIVANEKLLAGVPGQPFHFRAELTKIAPLTLPMEALKSMTFSARLMPGRAIALVSMIEQSLTELEQIVLVRSDLIDAFHTSRLPPEMFCQDYFGLRRLDGNTNAMYHDVMIALMQYTNDAAFFSAELAEELMRHAKRVREKLLKWRGDVPKVNSVDFVSARESGLMPPREDYSSWLSGISLQD